MPEKARKVRGRDRSRPAAKAAVTGRPVRGTTAERGYGYRWQVFARRFLAQHPLCVECLRRGVSAPAEVVDHVVPHKGDPTKFWSGPFQALCVRHHNAKSSRE